ncbi:MAG TPA: histidine kinase [Actinomycetota bacterium]|nr:histidine kinase [Actinomycetota bacterium]
MADNCMIVSDGDAGAGRQTDGIEALRASRRRLVLAADAERRAIERAFHDGLQQRLVGLAADLELAWASIETDPEGAMNRLADVRRDLRRTLEEARTLANRIHPALDAGGIGPALRLAAANADVRTRIDVALDTPLPTEIAGAVYFCCLDVLDRVDGTPTTITIHERDGGVAVEIVAEGEVDATGTVLRDRVEAFGGSLEIRSEDGPRTVWAAIVPKR